VGTAVFRPFPEVQPGTVKVYCSQLYQALGVDCRFAIMAAGFEHVKKMYELRMAALGNDAAEVPPAPEPEYDDAA
jgi:hypothetical protein